MSYSPPTENEQSHHYPNTTKSNPHQNPISRHLAIPPLFPPRVGRRVRSRSRRGNRASAAIKLLLWRRVSALPDKSQNPRREFWAGCPGTFSQSLCGMSLPRPGATLCVSFECDSLSEELGRGKEVIVGPRPWFRF